MPINVGTRITQGQTIYEVRDLIKEGGFGRAFLAEKTAPPPTTKVVVKVPKEAILAHPVWSQKFAREARILANISHPNVVKITAYWEFPAPSNEKALVQEYITGATELNPYVAAHADEAAGLFLQALYGTRAFHESANPAVVHRDISPANILVSDTGQLKIIDFGLAKEDPRATLVLTITGEWFGTPGCMSPEQAVDSASVDHRTDLYALGRTFTAALQGRNPQHANPAALPEPWRTLCTKLTEHDAGDRYQTARETLSAAFAAFAQAGVKITGFRRHADEANGKQDLPGWADLCWAHFSAIPDLAQEDLAAASRLNGSVFAAPFGANQFFDQLESSGAIAAFGNSFVPFEHGDVLGRLYRRLYPHLDPPRRERCFDRLCKTAVDLHRYEVMGDVRQAYAIEKDAALLPRLLAILNQRDPQGVIEGRGTIPR